FAGVTVGGNGRSQAIPRHISMSIFGPFAVRHCQSAGRFRSGKNMPTAAITNMKLNILLSLPYRTRTATDAAKSTKPTIARIQ
ncbi:hypothetical protein, partial [Sphingobium sp. Z007]|uniref:hypothetical protein n=1 Tax=Sphingobium sp. Z007 TaxID=627495 RepID=UPI001C52848C